MYVTNWCWEGAPPGWGPTEQAIVGLVSLRHHKRCPAPLLVQGHPVERIYQLLLAADQPTELLQLPASATVRLVSRTYRTRPDHEFHIRRNGFQFALFYSRYFLFLRAGQLKNRGSIPSSRKGYSILHSVQTASGAHPASYPMGNGPLFLGVQRPGREAKHSPPSSAEVKKAQCYTSTSWRDA
jgi:hypothetical protein